MWEGTLIETEDYTTIIDVSQWQGVVDWEQVKPHISGAIIRISQKYDGNYHTAYDDYFNRNCLECERLGIPYGVYLFSNATSLETAQKEAQFALNAVKDRKLSFPIFFDSEDRSTADYAHDCAIEFLRIIEEAGYPAGVYASTSWWLAHTRDIAKYNWIAAWGKNTGEPDWSKYPTASDIWQYTSNGSIPGISGRVDMSLSWLKYQEPDYGFKVGQKVMVKKEARRSNGKKFLWFVYKSLYIVKEITKDYAIIKGLIFSIKIENKDNLFLV